MTEITINLTNNAKQHIQNVLAQDEVGIGLRVGVKSTGCSGYQYITETAKAIGEHDTMIEINGIQIIVDEESLPYIAGTELDFVREGLNAGFKFNNPNAIDHCGCGESFSIKDKQES